MRSGRSARFGVAIAMALTACTALKDDPAINDDAGAWSDSSGDATPSAGGGALVFDGTNFASADATPFRLRDITIEVWAKFATGGVATQGLVAMPYGTQTGDSFVVWSQNWSLYGGVNPVDTSNTPGFNSPFAVGPNTWIHVALTFNHLTGDESLFVNGVPRGTLNAPTEIAYNQGASDLFVGSDLDYKQTLIAFSGTLDEIRIWSIARTPAEILATMSTALIGNEAGLEAYWPLDDGHGKTAHDATGHGHPLTLSNGASIPAWTSETAPISSAPASSTGP